MSKIREQKRAKDLAAKKAARANKKTSSVFKYELVLAYDGYNYGGFARQKHKNTVQNKLDDVLSAFLKKEVKTTEASRTDAKVNALDQHVMIEVNEELNLKQLKAYLNENLDEDIQILHIHAKASNFHVRYDVKDKTYEYLIIKQNDIRFAKKAWYIDKKLDIMSIKEASKYLIGKHDFATFQNAKTTSDNSVRTINSIDVFEDDLFIHIQINADGFLYNMVRLIVHSLVQVGMNKKQPSYLQELLALRCKPANLESAPAKGLTLLKINYKK